MPTLTAAAVALAVYEPEADTAQGRSSSHIPGLAFSIDEVVVSTESLLQDSSAGLLSLKRSRRSRQVKVSWDSLEVCNDTDVEAMSFDIASARYSAVFVGRRFDLNVPGSATERNASYQTRSWFQSHGLGEANLYPQANLNDLHAIFDLNGTEFFLTADIEMYNNCPRPTEAFLLSRPSNAGFRAARRVGSVAEFLALAVSAPAGY